MHEPKYHAHKAYSFGFPCQTKDAISLASLIHIVLIRSVGCFLFRFSPVRSETRPLCISCVFLGKKLASTGVFLNADGSIYNHIWEIIEVLKTTNWAPLWGCLLVQIPCQTKTLSTTTVTSKLVKGKERGGWGGLLFGYFYFIGHPWFYLVWFGEDRRQKGDFTLWVSRSRACGIERRTFVESPKTWAENT
jgi:hypothetical protein